MFFTFYFHIKHKELLFQYNYRNLLFINNVVLCIIITGFYYSIKRCCLAYNYRSILHAS